MLGYYLAGNYESAVETNTITNPQGAGVFFDDNGVTPVAVNKDIGGETLTIGVVLQTALLAESSRLLLVSCSSSSR